MILGLALVFVLTGCGVSVQNGSSKTTSTGSDGGIFRSDNKGANWANKSLMPTTSGRAGSFASVDGSIIYFDPTDSKTVYFGTIGEGLLYTYDRGDSWQRSAALGRVTVRALVVDPQFRCTIYAAVDNKIMKTVDCGRAWSQVYYDNDVNLKITALVMNNGDKSLMAGTTRGEIMKSLDRGDSWQVITRIKDKIAEIKISPFDNKVILIAGEKTGMQRSTNGGGTWESLSENMKAFVKANTFKDLTFSGSTAGMVFLANGYGILKSPDNGTTWSNINLLTPEANASINALAVSPKNDNEIYYVTNTTFYRSLDGGTNWTSKKLPSNRGGAVLMIDPDQAATVYMAVKQLQKK
jgi:photosystem II stability/assembly factor-like uncharacterized protein